MIECLPPSLSGPWPKAFIRAMILSTCITNIPSLYGERERKVRLLLTVWMITQSYQKPRSQWWQPWAQDSSNIGTMLQLWSESSWVRSMLFIQIQKDLFKAHRLNGNWTVFPFSPHHFLSTRAYTVAKKKKKNHTEYRCSNYNSCSCKWTNKTSA